MLRSLSIFIERKQIVIVTAVAFMAFFAGLTYSVVWGLGDTLNYYDGYGYVAIAGNIVNNHTFSLDGINATAFRPPGYPGILAIIAYLGGGITAFRILNYLALSLSLVLVFSIAKKQAGPLAGLLAMILVLGYPVFFYAASTIYPQTIASCLLLAILRLSFTDEDLGVKRAILIGLIFGLLILMVPTFLFSLALMCLWILLELKQRAVGKVALIVVAALLVVCPWLVRNYKVLNSFVFVSTSSGVNLLLGNSENTTPNAGCTVDISSYTAAAEEMDEVQTDRYYQKAALNYVTDNPGRAVRLYVLKFLNYFNYRNELATRSEASALRDMIMLFTYGPLLLIALIRLVMTFRMPLTRYERFAFSLYLLNGAFSAIFFTRIRFRLPFDFLLISICAMFISRLVEEKKNACQPDIHRTKPVSPH